MRKVIGIGETVLDIIFKNNQPDTAAPGGSTFNSMVSLGRAGVPAFFISEVGSNAPGSIILDFMKENGVSYEYVNVLPVKQPISMAFLNEKNDAEYSFYRDSMEVHPAFKYPPIEPGDVVLFGSFFALNPVIRPQVKAFLEYAKAGGAILYYDVNFRSAHKKDLGEIGGSIEENYEYADVVRGSNEDFITLYGINDPDAVYSQKIRPHCESFIYTKSTEPIEVRSFIHAAGSDEVREFRKAYPVGKVHAVSTIGAGDNFNAGFIYALLHEGINKAPAVPGAAKAASMDVSAVPGAAKAASMDASAVPGAAKGHPEFVSGSTLSISEPQWDRLISSAQAFSANCCTSMFNYITPEFAKSLK
jgi:fructokinase